MKEKKYAVIDIETTGGQFKRSRITEIAVLVFDGENIIDKFETLINPECSIPTNITKLTGITNEMVADAPKFFEVAKQIVEITKGAIFVAHNVSFDYNFVKEEFARLGYKYLRKQLCTVRLSRQAYPGRRSYSLDAMSKFFKIEIEKRHRAMDDAEAALIILKNIIAKGSNDDDIDNFINRGVQASKLPPNITLEQLHSFPEECGVYYFHNKKGDVIYVGKSINIKKRVMEHFANTKPRAVKMCRSVHEITYELTGSELVALLLESDEIKKIRPIHNRAQRKIKFPIGIHYYTNKAGYICFGITSTKEDLEVIAEYPKGAIASNVLTSIARRYELCKPFCGLEGNLGGNCFNFQLGLCRGACMQQEEVTSYNERAAAAIERLKLPFDKNFLILEKGRNKDEKAVVLIENGSYQGFGYADQEEARSLEDLKDCIKPYMNNPDVGRIIKQYLKSKSSYKMIEF